MKNEKETGYLELIKQFIGEIKYGNLGFTEPKNRALYPLSFKGKT